MLEVSKDSLLKVSGLELPMLWIGLCTIIGVVAIIKRLKPKA
ncbi:MAG: hypothetical protein QXR84_07145 [Candidatus Bathyarchaeia archaeon]